ncbi:DUF881 domain-containing protein [Acetivibrio saccincola]|jgi:uncharacterized protein YlxW (UPF0749 family)|uniref:DUF881 domain-containing protein n=1 Tax=Acetivibrio saccincola TaxID=1677857 RepID=A0A2K9E0V7_9FIRM|nr:DUF881 domain-containing protein [Acetivibrio saccincola]AUG57412.1 hypothetical protein HVS_07485 [Acetivibrio saccincola]NLW26562.1 DUF881 domain-containing protein [Acetivibrio saccincola]PQQ67339.1 hypothetical protein B9R14_11650 [Acetivibrio saccincola]HOA98193.1 DUF881 domain-containing protein [Acetivibrio saccincola]HQD29606.1 DUF881 domain-containing protein [Acetivibrio saccincola]
MGKSDKRNILLFVFMVLGFLLALQFRSVMSNTSKDAVSTAQTIESLKKELEREKTIGEILKKELEESIVERDTILRNIVEERGSEDINEEWERARILAGLTEVVGDGVVITLNDASEVVSGVSDPLLHDSSLYEVLNEIKKAQPVAISVNGERIISTTEIVCAGPTTRINRNRYAVPYEIKVIGDSKKIREVFLNSSIVVFEFIPNNIRFQIKEEKDIVIPKYSGRIDVLTNAVEVVEE